MNKLEATVLSLCDTHAQKTTTPTLKAGDLLEIWLHDKNNLYVKLWLIRMTFIRRECFAR